MSVSFGNFKLNEISGLIRNKDPLGLNADIESYSTIKNKSKSEVPLKTPDANQATDAEKMGVGCDSTLSQISGQFQ